MILLYIPCIVSLTIDGETGNWDMQLHHPHTRPDWELVDVTAQNRWQRLAARTHGVATPGNTASLGGICLVLAGLYMVAQGTLVAGFFFVIGGRLLDLLDGILADTTGTKSPLGAQIDASLDKMAAFAALAVLANARVMPGWLATVIAIEAGIIAIMSLIARQRFMRLVPSKNGKLSGWFLWSGVAFFFAGAVLHGQAAWLPWVFVAAYTVSAVSLLLGAIAAAGYVRIAFGLRTEKFTALGEFDRYIIMRNPDSTEAFRVASRIQELRKLAPEADITVFDTVGGGVDANMPQFLSLATRLGPRTLLCIGGGDGTANLAITCLVHGSGLPDAARLTPILPLWCGNANDLAYILNGRPTTKPVGKVMGRGRVVHIRPLLCTLKSGHASSTHLAASYASFGASAFATQEMERTLRTKSPIRRFVVSRFGQEVIAALWALMRSPTFRVEENGKTRVIFERTHLNGSRFAKVIGLPLRLTDERFHRMTIEHKHLLSFALHVLGLVGDRQLSKKTIIKDSFIVRDDVWAQFDGEPVRIPAGTTVTISIAKQPFYALSTRLAR